MKSIMAGMIIMLSLSSSLFATDIIEEGEFIVPNEKTLDFSENFSIAAGVSADYGLGASIELKDVIDISLGHAGIGFDYKFYRYDFMPRSRFFLRKPLYFYASGGFGYLWGEKFGASRQGFLVRASVGANWNFIDKWSLFMATSPAINFQQEYKEHGVVKTESGTVLIVMGTVGIRYRF